MRISSRGLLAYIAIACIMMALTRVDFVTGCLLLVACISAANFLVPPRIWRFVVYGGVAGIVPSIALLVVCHSARFGSGPHLKGSPGSDGAVEMIEDARPFVFQIGGLMGGTAGFVASRAWAKPAPRRDRIASAPPG